MQRSIIGVLTYRRKRTFDETAYFRQLSKEEQKVGQRGVLLLRGRSHLQQE
jgi:hypothetical protein